MKDLTITQSTLRREALWAVASFIMACGINVYAIVHYDRPWSELYTQIGFVLVIAVAIYLITAVPRILMAIAKTFKK